MKDRRPRKLKKVLKKKFERVFATKMLQSALSSVFAATQLAHIQAMPKEKGIDESIKATKALLITDLIKNSAFHIQSIMKEKPTKWQECSTSF